MRARARENLSCKVPPCSDWSMSPTHGLLRGCGKRSLCRIACGPDVRRRTLRSALAGLLDRVDRDRDREVERRADDAVLLDGVRRRVALAGRGALGPADVAELERAREDLQQPRRHVRARAHVARLLLDPRHLAQVRVARDLLEDLLLRERIQQLDARERDAVLTLARGVALEVVVDLAGAEDEALDLLLVDPRLGQHGEEARLAQVLD